MALARWLHRETGEENLCLAGGVALNCVMNARLRDRGPFKDIWGQPAAGDAGTSLGAALWTDLQQRRSEERAYRMEHAFLGPAYGDHEIEIATPDGYDPEEDALFPESVELVSHETPQIGGPGGDTSVKVRRGRIYVIDCHN